MILYGKDGQAVEVPDDQVAAALSTGQFGIDRPMTLVSPAGDVRVFDDPNAIVDATRFGFRPETGEEARSRAVQKKYGEDNVEAFLAGVARGGTIGLSDLFLTEAGIVDPETLAGIREANPSLSMGGEILGSFGPGAIAGKGLSLAARAFRAGNLVDDGIRLGLGAVTSETAAGGALRSLARGAAPKIGEWAALGATEGSLVGLQEGITEQALGDPGPAAESILARMGEGALTGMLFGGALGASSLGIGAVASKLSRMTEKAMGGLTGARAGERFGFGPKAAFDAFGIPPEMQRKLRSTKKGGKGDKWFRGAADDLTQPGVHPDGEPIIGLTTSRQEIQQRTVEAADAAGQRIGATFESLDALGEKLERTVDVLRKVPDEKAAGKAGQVIDMNAPLSTNVERGLGETVEAGVGPAQPMAGAVPDWADPQKWEKVTTIKESSFPAIDEIVARMNKAADELSGSSVNDPARAFLKEEALRIQEAKFWTFGDAQKWRVDLSSRWGDRALPGSQRDAIRSTERIIAEEIEKKAEEVFRTFGKREAFEAWKRDKAIYHHLRALADESGISTNLGGFLGFLGEAGRSFAVRAGVFGQGIQASLAGGALYGGAKALLGKGNILPGQVRVALSRKVAGLRLLQEAEEKTASRIDGAVSRLLKMATGEEGKGAFVAGSTNVLNRLTKEDDREKATKKFVEAVRMAQADPEILADRIATNLIAVEEHAPTVAAQMAQRMVHGLQLLSTLIPIKPLSLQPQHQKYSDADYTDLEEAAQAFADPVSVIEDLGRGIPPSSAAMAILRTVYSNMWELTTDQIAHALASSEQEVDYSTVLLLSSFAGRPLDWSVQPDAIARSQASYTAPVGGEGPGGVRLGGLEAMQGAMQNFQSNPGRLETGQLGTR